MTIRDTSRRSFLLSLGAPALFAQQAAGALPKIAPDGPASRYVSSVKAAFVRRKGDYGMLWAGDIWDGAVALKKYRLEIDAAAKRLGMRIDVRF